MYKIIFFHVSKKNYLPSLAFFLFDAIFEAMFYLFYIFISFVAFSFD